MINAIVDLLQSGEFYGISERVEISKGKYQKTKSFKQFLYKLKRRIKWLGK